MLNINTGSALGFATDGNMDEQHDDPIPKQTKTNQMISHAQLVDFGEDQGFVELVLGWVYVFVDHLVVSLRHVEASH